jgi:hypothetical protein
MLAANTSNAKLPPMLVLPGELQYSSTTGEVVPSLPHTMVDVLPGLKCVPTVGDTVTLAAVGLLVGFNVGDRGGALSYSTTKLFMLLHVKSFHVNWSYNTKQSSP